MRTSSAASPQKMNRLIPSLFFIWAVALGGCASSPESNNGQDDWDEGTADPLERYNRWVHSFNMTADEYLVRPVAVSYQEHVPEGVRGPIGNFLSNLREPFYAANYYLQGNGEQGTRSINRFFINSTLGFLGLFDVADSAGLKQESTDLGLTLGHWGVPRGPYIVLPGLGPSTLRASSGLVFRYSTSDYHSIHSWADVDHNYRYIATGLYGLTLRVDLLALDELMERSGADPYIFMRESYLQNRREKLDKEDWDDWDNGDWENGGWDDDSG